MWKVWVEVEDVLDRTMLKREIHNIDSGYPRQMTEEQERPAKKEKTSVSQLLLYVDPQMAPHTQLILSGLQRSIARWRSRCLRLPVREVE